MTESKTLATATDEEIGLEMERRIRRAEKEMKLRGVSARKVAPWRFRPLLWIADTLKLLAFALLGVSAMIYYRLGFPTRQRRGKDHD